MQRSMHVSRLLVATALAAAAPLALAQAYPSTAPEPAHPMAGVTHTPPFSSAPLTNKNQKELPARIPEGKTGLLGQHDMTGTVESVSSNGIVEVRTGLGTLKVHFPQAGKHLKKGDKITLHLSYSVQAPPAPATTTK